MSGFEAIGLILGFWPLIVNGLQVYKAAKNGQGWDLLCDEFRVEEFIYIDCVRHLLAADVSESNLLQLTTREKPNQHLWKDQALHRCLEKRLGPERTPMVLKTLQEMDTILSSLATKFTVNENTAVSWDNAIVSRCSAKIEIAELIPFENRPQHSQNQVSSTTSINERKPSKATRLQCSPPKTPHQLHECRLPSAGTPTKNVVTIGTWSSS